MKKQGRVRKHNKDSLSLIDNESKDSLKVSIDKPLHEWLSHFAGRLSPPAVLAAYSYLIFPPIIQWSNI